MYTLCYSSFASVSWNYFLILKISWRKCDIQLMKSVCECPTDVRPWTCENTRASAARCAHAYVSFSQSRVFARETPHVCVWQLTCGGRASGSPIYLPPLFRFRAISPYIPHSLFSFSLSRDFAFYTRRTFRKIASNERHNSFHFSSPSRRTRWFYFVRVVYYTNIFRLTIKRVCIYTQDTK